MSQRRSLATTLFLDSTPAIVISPSHLREVRADRFCALEGLFDGSFLSCSRNWTAKRWVMFTTDIDNESTDQNGTGIRLVGTYVSHKGSVKDTVEIDNNTYQHKEPD